MKFLPVGDQRRGGAYLSVGSGSPAGKRRKLAAVSATAGTVRRQARRRKRRNQERRAQGSPRPASRAGGTAAGSGEVRSYAEHDAMKF